MGAKDITDLKSFIENYEELKKINAQMAIEVCFAHLRGNVNLIKDIKDKQRGGNVTSRFGARSDDVMAIQHLSEILFRDMQPHIVNPKSKISLEEFNKVIEGIGYKARAAEQPSRTQPIIQRTQKTAPPVTAPFGDIKVDQRLKEKYLQFLDRAIVGTEVFQSKLKEPDMGKSLIKQAKKAIFSEHKTKAELTEDLQRRLKDLRDGINVNRFPLAEFENRLKRILDSVEKDYGKRVQFTQDNKELLKHINQIRNVSKDIDPQPHRKQTKP